MPSTVARFAVSIVVILACVPATASFQGRDAGWLDDGRPAGWNEPGQSIPPAPAIQGSIDARCRETARSPQLTEDQQLRERGWDLVGPYQGGWQILVIRGTASYDGMCRPRQYQGFVFVRGVFAGTLSPAPMDSRTDGALARVTVQDAARLTAEYVRYDDTDALCCPSRTTTAIFEIVADGPVVRPASTSTRNTAPALGAGVSSSVPSSAALTGTSWQLLQFEGGDGTTLRPDDPSRYTIDFAEEGRMSARIDCNRGRGTWASKGPNQIEFGPLALTRALCAPGSLHDRIVKQWGNIRSYVVRDGHLFLALAADGGIYEFAPAAGS